MYTCDFEPMQLKNDTHAKEHYHVKKVIGKTQVDNLPAIRLVEKLGFQKETEINNTIVLGKIL